MELPTKMWTATDLKDFIYCPRLVYWKIKRGITEPNTILMEHGNQQHDIWEKKENNRKYIGQPLNSQKKQTSIYIVDKEYGFSGIIDGVINDNGKLTITENKFTSSAVKKPKSWEVAQILLYCLLLQKNGEKVQGGIISYPGNNFYIEWTEENKTAAEINVQKLVDTIAADNIPAAPTNKSKCGSCFYSKYCW